MENTPKEKDLPIENENDSESSEIKILVVDDEESPRETLAELLAMHEFKVETVGTARQALETLEQNSFDLIISDLMMPKMNGQEASLQIYKMAPEIPILFRSGFGQIPDDAPAEDKNRLISKPFNYEDLKLALDTAIRRPLDERQS